MESVAAQSYEYRIVECLGEGLNSCVYRAFKESNQLGVRFEVGLKILKSEKLVALWRNEFERLMKVKSQYCVGLLGWEVIDGAPALVLEYVNGVNLKELLRHQRLTSLELAKIYSQARAGLTDLAHSGVCHGDLNLQNIMIDETGSVKLVDFGIKNGRKESFVTPKYAAPSVLMGAEPSLESDLFSLEAIRFELESSYLTDRHGFLNLAKKVALARAARDAERARTQGVVIARQFKLREIVWPTQIAICAIAACSALLTFGDARPVTAAPVSKLCIRTNEWMKIQIENHAPVYAPADVPLASGRIRIRWSNRNSIGEKTIEMNAGETKTLTDSFFTESAAAVPDHR